MKIDQTMIYIGILALGGLAIIMFAFLTLFKAAPKKQPAEKAPAKVQVPTKENKVRISAFKLPKLNNPLSKIKVLRKDAAIKPAKEPKTTKEKSMSPQLTAPTANMPEENTPSHTVSAPEILQVTEMGTVTGSANAKIAATEVIPAAIQEPQTNAAISQPPKAETLAVTPPSPQVAPEPPKEKTGSGAFTDMFNNEVHEESEASKFAKTLADVDINSLLETSRTLQNNLTRRRN